MEEELTAAHERYAAENDLLRTQAEKSEGLAREVEIMKVELTAARQNVEKAEFDKNKVFTEWPPLCSETSYIGRAFSAPVDACSRYAY